MNKLALFSLIAAFLVTGAGCEVVEPLIIAVGLPFEVSEDLNGGNSKIRIDGGVNQTFDLYAFVRGLDDAVGPLSPTRRNSIAWRTSLPVAMPAPASRSCASAGNRSGISPSCPQGLVSSIDIGPGRMDAITLVHNQVVSNGWASRKTGSPITPQ